MSEDGVAPGGKTHTGVWMSLSVLYAGIGVATGFFGAYLGKTGLMSAGQYGVYGMSDLVANLMLLTMPLVALIGIGGLAVGVVAATEGRRRKSGLQIAFAVAAILCVVAGGLVYALGWFMLFAGAAFHF